MARCACSGFCYGGRENAIWEFVGGGRRTAWKVVYRCIRGERKEIFNILTGSRPINRVRMHAMVAEWYAGMK